MPDPVLTDTFVLRRLADPLPLDLTGVAALQGLAAAAVAAFGLTITGWLFLRARRRLGTLAAVPLTVLRLIGFGLLTFAAAVPGAMVPDLGHVAWLAVTAGLLLLALSAVYTLYAYDRRAAGWKAIPLATLRTGVFGLLAWAFLLPAIQQWERTEKRSKVVVVLDVSPSVARVSDEVASAAIPKPKTRLDAVLDFLTDDKAGFVGKLLDKNPVTVYRFGGRLDDDAVTLDPGAAWSRAEWTAFAEADFKAFVVRGLSAAGREAVVKMPAWKEADPGTADWATTWGKLPVEETTPAGLTEADVAALADARAKLDKRADMARAVAGGTNVPESLVAVVARESGNLVQGVIVFTDGRSNLTSDAGTRGLRERLSREKIPLFTVAVGEAREVVKIAVADVQAPDVVPPGEEFKVVVEADGVGLPDGVVPVTLSLYMPGHDPKKDKPDHDAGPVELKFDGTAVPPHGQAEFLIDPTKLPDALTEPIPAGVPGAGKRRLKQGAWQAVARVAADKRERSVEPVHVSPPRKIEVIDRPTRVLLFAGGPTREYQTLRTLLVRETAQKRAELSICLQTEGGREGTAVQDVPPERLLTKFPTAYDTRPGSGKPEERFNNLNEYDLIVAFDPDWSELSAEQLQKLQAWVDNGGGGLVYVAGPLNTYQLARADTDGKFKPLLDVLPVVPDDIILLKTRPTPRTPRRLSLRPSAEFDVLRLADAPADDPAAGWEAFFTGADKLPAGSIAKADTSPKRGFYSYYPVKGNTQNPGATVLADFLDVNDRGEADPKPWLVTVQPKAGRTVFVGSGETWLFRAFDKDYFDRFWVKLTRYAAGGRQAAGATRGRVLLGKEFSSGSQVRVQVKLLGPNGLPYAAEANPPKFRVDRYSAAGDKEAAAGPFELRPRISGAGFDGYYAGQITADPARFPPGDKRYRVVVDVPDSAGDTLTGDFQLKRSDPELDNPRPDPAALEEMAGTLDEVRGRIKDPAVVEALRGGERDPAKAKLVFRLSDPARVGLIPACLEATTTAASNRGPVRDLWDGPATITIPGLDPVRVVAFDAGSSRIEIGWLLTAVVFLLGLEWLARKLMRLA